MKFSTKSIYTISAMIALTGGTSHGAIVFSEDFSEADGTAIIGKNPDVGQEWTGGAPLIDGGSFHNPGGSAAAHAYFTSALGAGQVLTLTYETLPVSGGDFFGAGYAGVSLYLGGSERFFTGDLTGETTWGVNGPVGGSGEMSSDSTVATTATFTYLYDTGAWTFTTASGVSLSGTTTSQIALDRLRIANSAGSGIHIDNLSVDITAVPEPSSAVLAGLFFAGLGASRRRK